MHISVGNISCILVWSTGVHISWKFIIRKTWTILILHVLNRCKFFWKGRGGRDMGLPFLQGKGVEELHMSSIIVEIWASSASSLWLCRCWLTSSFRFGPAPVPPHPPFQKWKKKRGPKTWIELGTWIGNFQEICIPILHTNMQKIYPREYASR